MFYEDIALGTTVKTEPAEIIMDDILSFSRDYDPLPIHYDMEYAKNSRFKKIIAPGVMTFMKCWKNFLKLNLFGKQTIAGKSTKIEWFAPVFEGDVLHGTATVVEKQERNKHNGLIVLNLKIYNSEGVHVINSFIETVVDRKTEDASENDLCSDSE